MYDFLLRRSLAAVFDSTQIVPEGKPVGAISITRLPAGASFFLRVGTAQEIEVTDEGVFSGFDPYNEGNKGVFWRNPTAQPGVTASLLIGFAPIDPPKNPQ